MKYQTLCIGLAPLKDAVHYKVDAARASVVKTLKGDMLKRVFVCSPYRDDDHVQIAQNVVYALKFCRFVLEKGKVPFAAHLLYPLFLDDEEATGRMCGMECAITMLNACDEVWVFIPRERPYLTEGMAAEVLEAARVNKPLKFFYYSEDGDKNAN